MTPNDTYNGSVIAERGIVAANHPLAASAGVEMFAKGGNAIDAAIAACLTVSVVEPAMSSIFGAGFMVVHLADGRTLALDNYIKSPAVARDGMYRLEKVQGGVFKVEGALNEVGHLAVGVPGSLRAYHECALRFGNLPWEELCGPSIRHARDGFTISRLLADFIAGDRDRLARFQATADVFLDGGEPRKAGSSLVRSDYAETLEAIGRDGPDLLYGGDLGRRVADDMREYGGILTLDDLRRYEVRERDIVQSTYRGYEIRGIGPCSSGGVILAQALNILEGSDLAAIGFGNARSVHVVAEALKIAFADRARYLGDPDEAPVPVEWLASKEYADRRRADIDPTRAKIHRSGTAIPGEPGFDEASEAAKLRRGEPASVESANTTHVTACDREGNMVSTTQTLNGAFGSFVTVPGTGMLLNNCMMIFDPRPGRRQSVGPSKRPVSSNTPTLVLRAGRPFMALGAPGATRIPAAVLQTIINVIDHQMPLQAAVEAPRCHAGSEGDGLLMEPDFSPDVVRELEGLGHPVSQVARVAGGLNAIKYRDDGMLEGAACWRADGAPAGISGGAARETDGGLHAHIV